MHSVFLHSTRRVEWGLLLALIVGLQGCGAQEAAPVSASVSPSNSQPETKPEANAPAAGSPETPAPTASSKVTSPSKTKPVMATVPMPGVALVRTAPSGTAEPKAILVAIPVSPLPAAAVPAQSISPVSDPGGEVAVKPSKPGLLRVGATSCKMCHKLQFTSWADTAHAKRTPPLDCESCHGSGSEYKAIPVMKDPAKAKAAGLILPATPFCATCHKRNWSEGMLKKAHAHKP